MDPGLILYALPEKYPWHQLVAPDNLHGNFVTELTSTFFNTVYYSDNYDGLGMSFACLQIVCLSKNCHMANAYWVIQHLS